jgi:hypothetical protein
VVITIVTAKVAADKEAILKEAYEQAGGDQLPPFIRETFLLREDGHRPVAHSYRVEQPRGARGLPARGGHAAGHCDVQGSRRRTDAHDQRGSHSQDSLAEVANRSDRTSTTPCPETLDLGVHSRV